MVISNWIHSTIGAVHFTASITGLATGAYLLLTTKGTKRHKNIGYVFTIALLLVNLSALFIYDFNDGRISVFHFLIPVSLFFLIYGIYPMIRNRTPLSIHRHIIGMDGAALGLWAAGATEFFVRELSVGLSKEQFILYSFLISLPFALMITFNIIYFNKQLKKTGKASGM